MGFMDAKDRGSNFEGGHWIGVGVAYLSNSYELILGGDEIGEKLYSF